MNRKGLRKDWRGISLEQLREKSGLSDAVFCHVNGFIGGAKSYDSAFKMAVMSLEAPDEEGEQQGNVTDKKE